MTWDEMLAKLLSRHPRIGENEGMVTLSEAARELASEYRWKFLIGESIIRTEAAVAYGTVAINALGTLLTLTPGSGAEVWTTSWKNRRVVISGRGEPYRVSSFGSTTTATLADAWGGSDSTGLSYSMYRGEYPMPADCDFGRELTLWDVHNNKPLDFVSTIDIKDAEALQPGKIGYPEGVARVQLELDAITGEPVMLLQFFPAPDAVYSLPLFYFKRPFLEAPSAGNAKPLWPANYRDLIWRRAEINLEQNPAHRVRLNPETKQVYYKRLWELKTTNDGGAEIARRIAQANSIGWSSWFRNVNFTSGGINPLVGG